MTQSQISKHKGTNVHRRNVQDTRGAPSRAPAQMGTGFEKGNQVLRVLTVQLEQEKTC